MTIIAELMLTEALKKIKALKKANTIIMKENKELRLHGVNYRFTIDSIMKTYREIFRMFEEGKLKVKRSQSELNDAIVRNGEYLTELASVREEAAEFRALYGGYDEDDC